MSIATVPPRTLTPLAVTWLEMLPPILQGDAWIQGILNAMALEAQRLIDITEDVAAGLIPTQANAYTIAIWEALLGVPSDSDATLETRKSTMLSRLTRGDGSGAQWERQMESATNGTYRYTEHDSGDPLAPWFTLAVDTALPSGVSIEGLRSYIRSITPANLHIEVQGGQTYRQLRDRHATYEDARDAYDNYDNMRYGAA